MMSFAIGIDLGTTYCSVGVFRNDRFEEISDDEGNFLTPSVVAFNSTECLIGSAAKRQLSRNYSNTISNALRFHGRSFIDAEVQADIRRAPFRVLAKSGQCVFSVQFKDRERLLTTTEVISMLLWKMKNLAERYLHGAVIGAVISCPVSWNMSQRQGIRDAAHIAELKLFRVIDASTCAVLAYSESRKLDGERNVLVYDLGGGNLNVTLATIEEGIIEVKAVAGDIYLGGEDFNNRLDNHLINEFKRKHGGKDITTNYRALSRLHAASESAKRNLSAATTTSVEVDAIFEGVDFNTTISRKRFEELNSDLFRSTLEPVIRVLGDAKVSSSQIHDIVLIGGSTRIPMIQQLISQHFNGKEPSKSLNADLGPCYGASFEAAKLAGDSTCKTTLENLLMDVQPRSLGIKDLGGIMTRIIARNTSIPTKKSINVLLGYRYSEVAGTRTLTSFPLELYEGERARCKDNVLIAKVMLLEQSESDLASGEYEIIFDMDANSILNVLVRDVKSGRSLQTLTLRQYGLTKEEINSMQAERPQTSNLEPPLMPPLPPRPKNTEGEMSKLTSKDLLDSQSIFIYEALDAFHAIDKLKQDDVKALAKLNDGIRRRFLDDAEERLSVSQYARSQAELGSLVDKILEGIWADEMNIDDESPAQDVGRG